MSLELNVLIVEDSREDAEILAYEMRRAGFALRHRFVDAEADYVAAIEAGVDVVLADYTLPNFSAMRALALIQERALDVPVIVVTGSATKAKSKRRNRPAAFRCSSAVLPP